MEIVRIIKKTRFSLLLLVAIFGLNFWFGTLFNNENIIFVTKLFGVRFSHIDSSLIYRIFTMLFFTNGWMTFVGITLMSFFLFRFEYLAGTKKTIVIFLICNVSALFFEYVFLVRFLGIQNFTDLAMSNGEFGVFAAWLLVERNRFLRNISALIISIFTLIMCFTPFWVDQIAHIAGFFTGVQLQYLFARRNIVE